MQSSRRLNVLRRTLSTGLAAAALLAVAWPAQADLTLTPAGMAEGFSLSTFATGFPTDGNIGPLGIAYVGSTVLVSDYPGNVRVFATDTDGQSAGAATLAPYFYGNTNAVGMAQYNGNIYMSEQGAGKLDLLKSDGTLDHTISSSIPSATGITISQIGTIYVSTGGGGIFTVNPTTGTATQFKNYEADGLSLSADNSVLYEANNNGHIYGFNTSDPAVNAVPVFDSGAIPGGVDGTAIGSGALAGNLFVNTNGGTVYEVNLASSALTQIASGGSRGDFVSVDPNNGTLLLTQTDSIIRLSPPSGGGFGNTVPEPSTWASFGLGSLGLGGLLLRARRRAANAA